MAMVDALLSANTVQTITLTPSSGTAQTATIAAMVGADGTNAGKAGLVPKPAATDNTKFLTGAGTWATPTNTTYGISGAYGTGNKTWVTTITAGGTGTPYYIEGSTAKVRLSVTGGYLCRIAKPLYAYVGAGYGSRTLIWETVEGESVKNMDHSASGLAAELGAIGRLGSFAFSAGC